MNDLPESPAAAPAQPQEPKPAQIEIVAAPNYRPVVTYTILVITVLVYALQMITLYWLQLDIPLALGMKVNQLIISGQLWRLFTPMLLHDDLLPFHILLNMYFLAIVGARLEKFTGPWRFLLLYIVAGFAGNVMSFLFSPDNSAGASTALFGLMGAQLIFVLQNRSFLADNGKPALQNILTLIGLNLVIGLTLGFIDNWGHIGGLVGGMAFAWFGGSKLTLNEVAYPRFRLDDQRGWRDQLLGSAFVLIVFGGLAAAKIVGLWPA